MTCTAGCSQPTPSLPDAVCTAGTQWSAGVPAFRDATSDWGLDEIAAEGTRLTAADFDGDGWTDLVVRRAGTHVDDFSSGQRSHWLLRNTGDGRFEDVTEATAFLTTRNTYDTTLARPAEVVVWGDVDNDGDLDAYTGTNPSAAAEVGETSEILLNDDGRFWLTADGNPVRRAGLPDVPAGASFIDANLDGVLDLWVTEYNAGSTMLQDRLYFGAGDGWFDDVTDSVGLTTQDWVSVSALNQAQAHTRSWGSTACDLNADGAPELLSASYGRSPNHLWVAQRSTDGSVTWLNRSVASGYAYDDDLTWTDNQFARCYCQANPGADGCTDVPAPAITCDTIYWDHTYDREPFRLGGNSATTVCADVNNDGHLDLLTTEIRHWWAGMGSDAAELLINTGDDAVTFERPGRDALGLKVPHPTTSWNEGIMTAAVFDFDNDGWPDLYFGGSDYPGNRGLLFHQSDPLTFTEVPVTDGIDHNRSHGVVTADFDRDGDLDVIVGHSRMRCGPPNDCYPTEQVRFFENIIGSDGNWIQLDLRGAAGSNRSAVGARVTVTTGDGAIQTQEVGGGHGHFGSQSDRILHFGLGKACEAEVTVRWPDAQLTTETWVLPAGHRLVLRPGQAPRG